jgi:subtilisin family serine protease
MYSVRYGGKTGRVHGLVESDDHIVVRTHSRNSVMEPRSFEVSPLSRNARDLLNDFERVGQFVNAGVEVLRTKVTTRRRALRDKARAVLKKEKDICFCGRALTDRKSGSPVVYTENFFIKFDGDKSAAACRKILKDNRLEIKQEISYARNAYFVGAPEGTGLKVFALAEKLLKDPSVELCHPELIRQAHRRGAFPQQWHLKKTTISGTSVDAHANVDSAWNLTQGENTIIAIIDDGVDLDHEEFRSSGKIVAPQNFSFPPNHPSRTNPRPGSGNNHGTACAGVACADGQFGASGVAPRARLMPIRLAASLGSQQEADAFVFAAQNGADVISCSWGPADGRWFDPDDPVHNQVVPLPDSTRVAIDFAVQQGRNGKGCVICWAAGNGNESVENDGYASYQKVIAVAACNDRSRKSAYSDFGAAIWCAFPSSNGEPSLTPGIWTVDRAGQAGYNFGTTSKGDLAGNYTNSFGGTSSATPGVAGVAALVLSRNPALRWDQVKDILKRSCDRIDTAGGAYDQDGHSTKYGFGRVNASKAVELAAPQQPDLVAVRSTIQDVPIADFSTSTLAVMVADKTALKSLKVSVDIEHTYIGDLVVSLKPPTATGVSAIVLHNRQGGSTDNIKTTFDSVSTPGLLALTGKSPEGTWSLIVEDKARVDTGRIRSVSLELHF